MMDPTVYCWNPGMQLLLVCGGVKVSYRKFQSIKYLSIITYSEGIIFYCLDMKGIASTTRMEFMQEPSRLYISNNYNYIKELWILSHTVSSLSRIVNNFPYTVLIFLSQSSMDLICKHMHE